MARRSGTLKRRGRSGLYMLLACGALTTLLLFGLSMLGPSSLNQAVIDPETPATTTAEEATTERTAENTNAEKAAQERKEAKEKKESEAEAREAAIQKSKVERAEAEKAAQQAAAEQAAAQEAAAQQAATQEASSQGPVSAPASSELYLSVPKMGLTDDYVVNSVDETTLTNGAGHVPQTGFPWQSGSNTYIASHVLGYEGTGSYMHFASLPSMTYGDEIFLSDANGNRYEYEVYEILQVDISETWVMDPVGSDVVSLQTCINPPNYDVRLVVRGKLVNTVAA